MNRHEFALAAATDPALSTLPRLAKGLVDAIEAVEAEGEAPERDPAICVIGAFIAFHTHADVNSVRGYSNLLSLCEERLAQLPVEQ